MTAAVDFTKIIEPIARHYFGEPNRKLSQGRMLRFGSHGSMAFDLDAATWYDHEEKTGGGMLDLIRLREGYTTDRECFDWLRAELGFHIPEPGARKDAGGKGAANDRRARRRPERTIAATYDYTDESDALLFQVVRYEPKDFRQRRILEDGSELWSITGGRYDRDGDRWRSLKDGAQGSPRARDFEAVRLVPYRLAAVLAAIAAGRAVYVVEGEKDVHSLERLGFVATCNAGGSGKWREEFGTLLTGADVVVLGDNDAAGATHADQVCASFVGRAARIRRIDLAAACPALGEKGDVSDWIADHGGDAAGLTALTQAAPDWVPRAPDPGFPVLSFADMLDYRPSAEWLVDGWIGEGQFAVIYGAPKTGKSFIAIDMAMRIAHGWRWLGLETKKGGVFYVAAEGGDGVKKRVAVWGKENAQREPGAPFMMAPHRFDLYTDASAVDAIAGYVASAGRVLGTPFRLIVIDTLARSFGGGDESFAGDMNKVIENCDRLRAATGCAVLLVHHAGKDKDRKMRGSTALYGAVDAVMNTTFGEDENGNELPSVKVLKLTDQKDGEAGMSRTLALRQRVLDHDEAGRPVTSCVVEAIGDDGPEPAATPPEAHGASDSALAVAVAALEAAVAASGVETAKGRAAPLAAWCDAYAARAGMAGRAVWEIEAALRPLATALIASGRVEMATHEAKGKCFVISVPF